VASEVKTASMDDKTATMDDKTAAMDDKTATMVSILIAAKRPDVFSASGR
jgi:hypothetical protein